MSENAGEGIAGRVGAKRPPSAQRGTPADADGTTDGPRPTLAEVTARAHADHLTLAAELSEIDLLVHQARTEAARHESKRVAAADRLAALGPGANPTDVAEQTRQQIALTRRAALMQAQVDVLEGKLKILQRFRDSSAQVAADLEGIAAGPVGDTAIEGTPRSRKSRGSGGGAAAGASADEDGAAVVPLAVSRIVLGAQEDLRREIARTMHDGPAQSLTNIVLQAQIVERLLARDPASAQAEVRQLISMVQQTLDATKSFIFDVRPMVLDDLGLVPTIRRAARERGRRAQIPVEFESFGADRRLGMELESGLFRILDETLAAHLAARPQRVTIRLDWADGLEARIAAHRPATPSASDAAPSAIASATDAASDAARDAGNRSGRGRAKAPAATPEVMPAALAAMIDDRRAAETAAKRAVGALPVATRREIEQRAATLGIALELIDDGREVRLVVEASAGGD